ncbi:hypothetical protein D3C75_1225300 [compost metagenome]
MILKLWLSHRRLMRNPAASPALTEDLFIMPRRAYTRIGELMMTEEVSSVRKVRVLLPWNWMVLV